MESGLVNHLPELFGRDSYQFSRALECPVTSGGSLFQGGYLFGCRCVFALRVVRRFHLHFAQGDDVRPTDNTDVFAAGRGSQPSAEVLLGIRDRKSLHTVFIQTASGPVKYATPLDGSVEGEGRRAKGK